jgi:hypothetical protein
MPQGVFQDLYLKLLGHLSNSIEKLAHGGWTPEASRCVAVRHPTEWRLTEFPCDVTHALPSKEFAKWSPEIQNTVPLQNSTVSEAVPIGTQIGTEVPHKAPTGTHSGTVTAENPNSRYLRRDTISLPGAESSEPVRVPVERPAQCTPKAP